LADCKVDFWKIYEEKASGKNTDRPELLDCLSRLDEGDTLWIHSIDRLARSLQDLQNIISQLIAKGVTVKFVTENLTFTRDNHDPFTKLLFDVLGSFAEFARNILRERQREGIEKAKAAGKYAHGKGGRKKSVDRVKVRTLREQGVSFRKIAEQLGCSLSSVQRVIYGETQ
jgi:DNA invertase Pin-like site-specific DNA recombinase